MIKLSTLNKEYNRFKIFRSCLTCSETEIRIYDYKIAFSINVIASVSIQSVTFKLYHVTTSRNYSNQELLRAIRTNNIHIINVS